MAVYLFVGDAVFLTNIYYLLYVILYIYIYKIHAQRSIARILRLSL